MGYLFVCIKFNNFPKSIVYLDDDERKLLFLLGDGLFYMLLSSD